MKTEVRPPVCRKPEIVIATFVVARGLETILLDITREVTKKIPGKRKIFCLQVGKSHLVARVRFRLSHDDNHGGQSQEVILPSLFSRSRKKAVSNLFQKKSWQLLLLGTEIRKRVEGGKGPARNS